MSRARLTALWAGLIVIGLAGCHRLPNDSVYLNLAQTPPTVRAALALEYNPSALGTVARYVRHGQFVYRIQLLGAGASQSWVEFNPAGDRIAGGTMS